MTEEAFTEWLGRARPGAKTEYHRGYLPADRDFETSSLPTAARDHVSRTARAALRAYGAGLVELVQKRHGPADYSYLAIRKGKTS